MYAGRVACCPQWVMMSMSTGETEGWTPECQTVTLCFSVDRPTWQDLVGGRLRHRCRHLANWRKHTHHLWLWPIRSILWKHDVIHRTGSTERIELPSEEDRETATGNMYIKFGEIWKCGFWDMRGNKQTNRQWLQYFAPIYRLPRRCNKLRYNIVRALFWLTMVIERS